MQEEVFLPALSNCLLLHVVAVTMKTIKVKMLNVTTMTLSSIKGVRIYITH